MWNNYGYGFYSLILCTEGDVRHDYFLTLYLKKKKKKKEGKMQNWYSKFF